MNRQQSLGGGARGFIPLEGKNLAPLQTDQNNVIMSNKIINNEVSMKKGFTLAEVLITLGIIGVVAAMTMPTLIKKYTNHVVETRLKVFYSQVNEAIRLSEAEYGDKKEWANGAPDNTSDNIQTAYLSRDEWFQKYVGKHMKIVKKELNIPAISGWSSGGNLYYLANGSAFGFIQGSIRDWIFFPGNPDKCLKRHPYPLGRCAFAFNFYPTSNNEGWQFHYNKGVEPWKYQWDGTLDGLKSACGQSSGKFCTALIQYHNWTIPDDYPFQVSY